MKAEGHLRADAARNAARILRAAREVFAEQGPEASLDEIARRAGVGARTLYRRFPNKEELVRAAVEQFLAEDLASAIEEALGDDDPGHGLVALLAATLSLADRERNTLAAATDVGALTAEISAPLLDTLAVLTDRGQRAGVIRDDLVPDDLPHVLGMLVSLLWSMPPGVGGWRRYVALLMDALSPEGATRLPPPAACATG